MAIAYALARAGERDVMVLEKAQLTHGSTWHAAGLVGQLRNKKNLTRLMQASVAVFDRLETETGQAVDWRKTGSIRIASSAERMLEIRRSLTQAKSFGFEAEEISAAEAQARFPWMTIDGVVGAAWIPSDGYIDPYALTMAYASAARAGGVTIHEGVLVTGFETSGRRITSVLTDAGRVGCDILVNAAGIWAKRLGAMMGVSLATGAVEHQYVVTAKTIDVPPETPTFRDPDRIFYLKPDVRAFAIGGWERGAPACWPGRSTVRIRARVVPAGSGSAGGIPAAGGGTAAGAERDRPADGDQRADPGFGGWRTDHGTCARAGQRVRRLRVHRGDRSFGRRGRGHGELDPRRRSGHGPLAVRRAAIRGRSGERGLCRGAQQRRLWPVLRAASTGRGDDERARRADEVRCTARWRLAGRYGARRPAGSGRCGSTPGRWKPARRLASTASRAGSMPSAQSIARCVRAWR